MNQKPRELYTMSDRLDSAMEDARMNQRQLSLRTGVPGTTISRWRLKPLNQARVDLVRRVADAVDVHVDWLMLGVGPRKVCKTLKDCLNAYQDGWSPETISIAHILSQRHMHTPEDEWVTILDEIEQRLVTVGTRNSHLKKVV